MHCKLPFSFSNLSRGESRCAFLAEQTQPQELHQFGVVRCQFSQHALDTVSPVVLITHTSWTVFLLLFFFFFFFFGVGEYCLENEKLTHIQSCCLEKFIYLVSPSRASSLLCSSPSLPKKLLDVTKMRRITRRPLSCC